jgi:hypothetical protein
MWDRRGGQLMVEIAHVAFVMAAVGAQPRAIESLGKLRDRPADAAGHLHLGDSVDDGVDDGGDDGVDKGRRRYRRGSAEPVIFEDCGVRFYAKSKERVSRAFSASFCLGGLVEGPMCCI